MSTWQIIVGMCSLLVAGIILNYCNNTRKKEGPLYSSSYLSLSDEEKKFFDKDSEYERVTIVYGLIGIFFVFIALMIMTLNKVFAYLAFACILADLIYMIVRIIKIKSNK